MKNKVLTFLMVIGMVGLLVGCSKFTKATVKGQYAQTEIEETDNVYKTNKGKDILDFSVSGTKLEENEKTKFINEAIEKEIEFDKEFYDGEYKEKCLENLQYMASDDIVFEAQLETDIEYNKDDIVSVMYTRYDYCGGPHGHTYYYADNFDVAEQKTITFYDVFEKGKEDIIKKAIVKEVERLNKEYHNQIGLFDKYEDYIPSIFDDQHFYFGDDKIIFIFDTDIIAPYAAGPFFIEIPVKELKDVIIFRK